MVRYTFPYTIATMEFAVKTGMMEAHWCKSDCGESNGLCV